MSQMKPRFLSVLRTLWLAQDTKDPASEDISVSILVHTTTPHHDHWQAQGRLDAFGARQCKTRQCDARAQTSCGPLTLLDPVRPSDVDAAVKVQT